MEGDFQGTEEYLAKKSDGSKLYIEVNGHFIFDDQNQPEQMIFVTRDISKRKDIERKLLQTYSSQKNLVNSIRDVLYERFFSIDFNNIFVVQVKYFVLRFAYGLAILF